jgi:hypothetical protein
MNFIVAQILCNIVVGFDSFTVFKGRSSLLAICICVAMVGYGRREGFFTS